MTKVYKKPEIEVMAVSRDDVICTSGMMTPASLLTTGFGAVNVDRSELNTLNQ